VFFLHFVESCCFWFFCIWLPSVCLFFSVGGWLLIFLHFPLCFCIFAFCWSLLFLNFLHLVALCLLVFSVEGWLLNFFAFSLKPPSSKRPSRHVASRHNIRRPRADHAGLKSHEFQFLNQIFFFLCLTAYWICSSINKSKWNNMVIFGWIKPNAWYLYLKFCQICKYLIILSWFKYEIHNMSILLFAIRHFMNLNIIISTIFFQSWKFGNTFGARAFETPLPCWLRMGCGWDGGFMAGLLVCPIFFLLKGIFPDIQTVI